jgi:hypothetical protein
MDIFQLHNKCAIDDQHNFRKCTVAECLDLSDGSLALDETRCACSSQILDREDNVWGNGSPFANDEIWWVGGRK